LALAVDFVAGFLAAVDLEVARVPAAFVVVLRAAGLAADFAVVLREAAGFLAAGLAALLVLLVLAVLREAGLAVEARRVVAVLPAVLRALVVFFAAAGFAAVRDDVDRLVLLAAAFDLAAAVLRGAALVALLRDGARLVAAARFI
jgi:hypothetical protein